MPLHRAVIPVKLLPEAEAWAAAAHQAGLVVQYALSLDREVKPNGRCYWTVEARVEGTTWRHFYVSPDGTRLLDNKGQAIPR